MSGEAEVVLGGATAANTLPATDFAGSFPVDAFARAPVGFCVLLQALPLAPPLFAFEFVDIVFLIKQKTKRQSVDESSQKCTRAVAERRGVECVMSRIILFSRLSSCVVVYYYYYYYI